LTELSKNKKVAFFAPQFNYIQVPLVRLWAYSKFMDHHSLPLLIKVLKGCWCILSISV